MYKAKILNVYIILLYGHFISLLFNKFDFIAPYKLTMRTIVTLLLLLIYYEWSLRTKKLINKTEVEKRKYFEKRYPYIYFGIASFIYSGYINWPFTKVFYLDIPITIVFVIELLLTGYLIFKKE